MRTRDILATGDLPRGAGLTRSIEAMVVTLRAIRHGNGTLARFHGGSSGAEGRLDRVLGQARVRTRPNAEGYMGYVRLHGGRVAAIMDCARPPGGMDATSAHASTLAFELSSGRYPIVVNCGPGETFGHDWLRVPRTSVAHNTLALDKTSSSQLAPTAAGDDAPPPAMVTRPSMVTVSQASDRTGSWLQARHDGYLADYGLVHERRFFISTLGDQVHGEDVLLAPDTKGERRFAARIRGAEKLGVLLALHFHVHPDVEVDLAQMPERVLLKLGNGEVWTFTQTGAEIEVETSAYLDPARPAPLPIRQIVVRARALTHDATLNWSFVRTKAAPRRTTLPERREVPEGH